MGPFVYFPLLLLLLTFTFSCNGGSPRFHLIWGGSPLPSNVTLQAVRYFHPHARIQLYQLPPPPPGMKTPARTYYDKKGRVWGDEYRHHQLYPPTGVEVIRLNHTDFRNLVLETKVPGLLHVYEDRIRVFSNFYFVHLSDLLRLCLVYLHGGVYADLDLLFLRPISDTLNVTHITREKKDHITNSFFMGPPRAGFLREALRLFPKHYDPKCWDCAGPKLIYATWRHLDEKGRHELTHLHEIPYTNPQLPYHFKQRETTNDRRTLAVHLFSKYGHPDNRLRRRPPACPPPDATVHLVSYLVDRGYQELYDERCVSPANSGGRFPYIRPEVFALIVLAVFVYCLSKRNKPRIITTF